MAIVTLTTDFGTGDWFVGSMKGVILGISGRITVVDITHDIPAGDIRAAAFALAVSYQFFPRNTVHCAVVDPGVGSERAAIAVRSADYFFVGPDNGVLSFALAREKVQEIRRLENEACFRRPISNTFHGRDIFAPVAARLTQGIIIDSLGPAQSDYVRSDWPEPALVGNTLMGQVVYIDRFGNAITNIDGAILQRLGVRPLKISVGGQESCELKKFYQEVPPGQPLALVGSTGFVEIAVNAGNAAKQLGIKLGDPVELR
jgi:S-adenosylmethionine hydrolase